VVADGDALKLILMLESSISMCPKRRSRALERYVAPEPRVKRGYLKFYSEHVAPASEGRLCRASDGSS